MAAISKAYGTSRKLEQEGVWFDYGEGVGRWLLARAGGSNQRFNKVKERHLKPLRRRIQSGNISEDMLSKVMIQIYAEAVVLDWRNVVVNEGDQPLEYSRENVIKVLTDYPDLFNEIMSDSTERAPYLEDLEEDSKN